MQNSETLPIRAFILVVIFACLVFSGCQWRNASPTNRKIELLTKSAEQGDASAQFNLGYSYANGDGIAQDKAAAAKWYRKSAEHGYAPAQFILGFLYEKGEGVHQNKAEAAEWYWRAAEQGFLSAENRLSFIEEDERIAQLMAKNEADHVGGVSMCLVGVVILPTYIPLDQTIFLREKIQFP